MLERLGEIIVDAKDTGFSKTWQTWIWICSFIGSGLEPKANGITADGYADSPGAFSKSANLLKIRSAGW